MVCAQSDQSLCLSLEDSLSVKLLTEHYLEFLSLKGGCTGSSVSVYTGQNTTLLEITCHGSFFFYLFFVFIEMNLHLLPWMCLQTAKALVPMH